MSIVGPEGRSFKPISLDDLEILLQIAVQDRIVFFEQHPAWSQYRDHMICIALCQGAAQHYMDSKTGINDFDVYTFYKKLQSKRWYAKRIKSYDFGNSKFGQSIDKPNYKGRRVDCLARSIDVDTNEDGIAAVQRYLFEQRTKTAQLLARRPVILLQPNLGKILWPARQ